jgi:hypothetical protein
MAAKKGAKKVKRGAKKARTTKKAAKTAKKGGAKYKRPAAARRPPVDSKRARRSTGRHAPKNKQHVTFAGKPDKSVGPDEEDDEFGPLRADQKK